MNEADYGVCKDKDFSSEDRLVLNKNYFSTESQLPNLPNSITSNLIQSQTTNVFSQASISLIKINTLESAPKGGFISSLSNETTINDQSKRFSYDNLIPTSQLFGIQLRSQSPFSCFWHGDEYPLGWILSIQTKRL